MDDWILVDEYFIHEDLGYRYYLDGTTAYAGLALPHKVVAYSLDTQTIIDSTTTFSNHVYAVYADEDYLYIGINDEGVYVVDRHDLSNIIKVFSGMDYDVTHITSDNVYLYVNTSRGFHVYSLNSLAFVTTLTPPGTFDQGIASDENYIYAGSQNVTVYDKFDFSTVATLSGNEDALTIGVYRYGNYLYVTKRYVGMEIYDLSDFSLVHIIPQYEDAWFGQIIVNNDFIIVGSSGTQKILLYDSSTFELAGILEAPDVNQYSFTWDNNSIYAVTEKTDYYVLGRYSVAKLSATTNPATNITATTMQLNGSLNGLGNYDNADCYFQYTDDLNFEQNIQETTLQNLAATGEFSDEITGLEAGKTYYFRAVARAVE